MSSLKCKSCGEIIPINKNETSVVCPSCGNQYAVPMDEKKEQYLNLYSRADDAWDHKDFEEAAELYQQILNIDNTQSEAHFGLVMCKYGITYEIDPVTQKKMPTCNRINRDSILSDRHYLTAIKHASKDVAASFERRAQEIDRISRDFLKIVDKEPPYDVFISYKRTAEDGSLTQDSKVARKLYYHLKDKGMKVFFAEETLKSVAGEKFEPYIFAALSSAPVMILMGSRRDHFEATWVKNEWRRYLVLMNQGLKKTLIPAYFDMDPYNMPGELRTLQAMNAADITFQEDITEIIRKKLADAKEGQEPAKDKPVTLRDKYATKDKVNAVLNLTDCDREFAINVLVQCHGDVNKSKQFIEEDPDYKKSVWHCTECKTVNTHDKCRNCGITKKESIQVERARKEMEERERKKAEQNKRKATGAAKKLIKPILIAAAVICLFAFVIWPNVIQPNQEVTNLYTPEIVQTYVCSSDGHYIIVTISECTESGAVTATWEEIGGPSGYCKYILNGQIASKKNNGDIVIEWSSNVPEIAASKWTDEKTSTITKNYTTFTTNAGKDLTAGSGGDYQIKSASDLAKLSNSKNVYMLESDIDLSGQSWKPIEGFAGVLIGNGHTIKNLKIDASTSNVGFFATLDGTVMNLNFENVDIKATGYQENVGALCGKLNGTITGINVSGSVKAQDSKYVGGVVGRIDLKSSNVVYSNLENKANVSGADYVGGIFGTLINKYGSSSATTELTGFKNSGAISGKKCVGGISGEFFAETLLHVSECVNTGSVTGTTHVGGVVGYTYGYRNKDGSYITNSSCAADITAEAYVGCIVGDAEGVMINSCTNTGSTLTATKYVTIDGVKAAYVGGFAGKANGANNCVNEVEINYTAGGRYVGGIIGYVERKDSTVTSSNLENKANINGADYVGGIFGTLINKYGSSSATTELTGFKNSGAISGKKSVGGISGEFFAETLLHVSECVNTGSVTGATYVGGVVGYTYAYRNNDGSYITNSSCAADITAEAYVGCIVGVAEGTMINSCTNTGSTLTATKYVTVDGTKIAYVGGFAGKANGANDCVNEVDINYTAGGCYVGGIIGYVERKDSNVTSSNLENKANISGADYVGGIFGRLNNKYGSSSAKTQLSDFRNSGNVSGKSNVGGMIGECYAKTKLFIIDFVNTGTVNGTSIVGGIVGNCYGYKDSYIQDSSTTSGNLCGKTENVTVN